MIGVRGLSVKVNPVVTHPKTKHACLRRDVFFSVTGLYSKLETKKLCRDEKSLDETFHRDGVSLISWLNRTPGYMNEISYHNKASCYEEMSIKTSSLSNTITICSQKTLRRYFYTF